MVGKPVVAHELPDVFDRVQFRRSWRQEQERDVGRDQQFVGGMPAGLIDDKDCVRARRYLGRDLFEVPLHGLGVSQRGRTRAAPTPRAGQMAPKM